MVTPCAVALDGQRSVYARSQEHLAQSTHREMEVVPANGLHVIATTACGGRTKSRAGSTVALLEPVAFCQLVLTSQHVHTACHIT